MTEELKLQINNDLPLREAVFVTLRDAILHGTLRPGDRLMEIHLAARLGVSRTPVREAIRMLEQEGLARTLPRRGAVVGQITQSDLQDVLEVRSALEELAVRKACRSIDARQISELERAARIFAQQLRAGDLTASARADEEFHGIISTASGNVRLAEFLEDIRSRAFRYRMEDLKNEGSHDDLIRQHALILEALRERDEEKAAGAVKEHIRRQLDAIIENLG